MSDAQDDIFPTAPRRPAPGAPARQPAPPSPGPPEAPAPRPPAPASEPVVLEFGSFREFIDDYSPYISTAGMFVLDSPRQPGESLAFEVRLSDDFRLIHGQGEVEWAVPSGTPGRRAGAALRFTDLDESSRRLVARLVDNHRSGGGVPFDLEDRPPVAAEAPAPPPVEPSAGLGTETIALPTALAGRLAEEISPPESVEPPPIALETESPAEAGAPYGAAGREPAVLGPESAEGSEDELEVEPLPPLQRDDQALPAEGLAGQVDPVERADEARQRAPADDDLGLPDLEGAATEVVEVEALDLEPPPISLDAPAPVEPVAELADPAAPDREPPPPDAGFEPAELTHVPETKVPGSAEEVLPEMPLELEIPAAAEPAPTAGVEAPVSRPAAEPAPVEMPDREDLVADYYRTRGPPRRGRTFFWVGLCALAVVAGAAAWRFKDAWIGLLPESVTGVTGEAVPGGPGPAPETQTARAGERPAAGGETGDVAPGGEPTQPPPASETGVAAGGERADPAAAAETGAAAGGEASDPIPPGGPAGGAEPADPVVDEPAAGGGSPASADAAAPPSTEGAPEPGATAETEAAEEAERPPAPEPAPAAPPAPGVAPRRLTDLSFRVVDGVTEVLIAADAAIPEGGFEVVRVAQPPARQVIKVYGPAEPYPREAVAVGSEHVRRLRTGVHRVAGRSEIHVVADLTGPGVTVVGTETRGSTLIVRFARR